MLRLVELEVIDTENHIYRIPSTRIERVFDGDVALDSVCYKIDAIDNRVKLRRPPAFTVRALAYMDDGAHRMNFEASMGCIVPSDWNKPHRAI